MSNELDDYRFPVGKVIGYGLLFFVVVMALGWITMGNDFFMYKFFAPRQEEVRREVYEETHSYKQGSVQRLNTLCTQIAAADDTGKSMLNQVVAHEFASWNSEDVPNHLRSCLSTARTQAK